MPRSLTMLRAAVVLAIVGLLIGYSRGGLVTGVRFAVLGSMVVSFYVFLVLLAPAHVRGVATTICALQSVVAVANINQPGARSVAVVVCAVASAVLAGLAIRLAPPRERVLDVHAGEVEVSALATSRRCVSPSCVEFRRQTRAQRCAECGMLTQVSVSG
ncbi:MAG: hypothetical protein QOJ92_782 [Frankiales bacterium]|nr:hypothetical protein [Frankiales bacterium]